MSDLPEGWNDREIARRAEQAEMTRQRVDDMTRPRRVVDRDELRTADRVYPLPAVEDDPRFDFGLLHDVAAVLERHGYPPVRHGLDLVALQQALYGFLHSPESAE